MKNNKHRKILSNKALNYIDTKGASRVAKFLLENSQMDEIYLIAEIGVNHNGDLNLAFQLIDAAKSAGADIVKFQIFKADRLASKYSKKATYQAKNNPKETQYQMLKKLELSYEMYKDILLYCKKIDIECIASAFDIDDINFLLESGQTVFKIPSGEIIVTIPS